MRNRTARSVTMPAMVLFSLLLLLLTSIFFVAEVHAQSGSTSAPATAPMVTSTTTPSATQGVPIGTESSSTASVTPTTTQSSSTVSVTPTTTEELPPAQRTAGPAVNPFAPGTVNCLTMPYCGANEECFVLKDGLVCLEKAMNWGYILSRNNSGVPAVPSWSGQRSQVNANCSLFQMPESADRPGLALMVYDLIRDTLPKDLLISRFDQVKTNWYTLFSNCEPNLACIMGKCQPRPTLGQSCTSSWQCNPQALGLNENNAPIPTANTTEVRCEYEGGNLSVNTTCQLLTREANTSSHSEVSAWEVILPVVAILILIYFGTVIYQRWARKQKLGKWSRVAEDDRNEFPMDAYDEIH